MRMLLAAFVGIALVGAAAPAAAERYYPWCAEYLGQRGASTNCGFTSHAQCLADVRGVGGFCRENPFNRQRYAEPQRRKHRRHYAPY
jgi:hypothetical protein